MAKLFRVPEPWDYHEYGGFIVLADSVEEAVEKVRAKYPKGSPHVWGDDHSIRFDEVKELDTDIYVESGCDC